MNHSSLVLVPALSLLALVAPDAQAGTLLALHKSIVPGLIRLAGTSGGVPDAQAGQFRVVVIDDVSRPVAGCSVVIDLSNCPDLVLCSDQADPKALTHCAEKNVRKFTNALGEVTFTVLGGSTGAGTAATLANGARVYANGVLIGAPSVAAFDLDGSGGVGAGDLTVWLGDFGSGYPYGRSDFDGDGSVGAGDLSQWLSVFGAGGSTQSCGANCP